MGLLCPFKIPERPDTDSQEASLFLSPLGTTFFKVLGFKRGILGGHGTLIYNRGYIFTIHLTGTFFFIWRLFFLTDS
jgi:hypothetical protein